MLIDRDIGRSHALVVDSNTVSREVMAQMLRDLGFRQVRQAHRIRDAREMLELRRYDVVVCDHDCRQGQESTQDLLEELQSGQLPYATVFVMVTGAATYAKVTEAAEAALDSYLVKPFTAQTLADRIRDARLRKRELMPIFDALQARDLAGAAERCREHFQARRPFHLYAARVGAELMLRLKRPQEARALYEAADALRPQAWSQLGVARAELALGEAATAQRRLNQLLSAQPQYGDALDVLGLLQLEQGHLDEALATLEAVARQTPQCVLRQQQGGILAFHLGRADLAQRLLAQSCTVGGRSRLFDAQTWLLLAFLHFDAGRASALAEAVAALQASPARPRESARQQRLRALAQALALLHEGAVERALAAAERLAAERDAPEFDIEAALHLMALWVRLAARHPAAEPPAQALVQALARRFCVSKATGELMARVARVHEPAVSTVRSQQAQVLQLVEDALNMALHGDPTAAVQQLLDHGEHSGNTKLIDLAVSVARRHRARMDGITQLLGRAGVLSRRWGHGSAMPHLRQRGRPPGGLALRA